ncbi:K+-dependent Na+/Ca+ exchanger, partial [Metarhizium majus ARSEF 297]
MREVPSFWGFDPAPISPHYRKGFIICGFPGIGKTDLAKKPLLVPHYRIIEEDSSVCLGYHGNANFVAEYCKELENTCQRNTIVLASTHQKVLDELFGRRLPFVMIYPRREEKDEWIARLQSRGSSDALVNLVRNDWDALFDHFMGFIDVVKYSISSGADLLEIIEDIVTHLLDHLEGLRREADARGE